VDLHRIGQQAIREGIDGLVRRNGYRGPLRHVQGKERLAYQQRLERYYQKYPPRKGQLVNALVTHQDRKTGQVHLKLGNYAAVLVRPDGRSPSSGFRPGDVVAVRLLEEDKARKLWRATVEPAPLVQAALLSMELETGKVRTMLGGKDFTDSTFNRATQARRQPGSAFKPIIYAAAVERGYGPNSVLLDEPLSLPGGRAGQAWSPQNYDHTFSGPITLATALAKSRNVPAVRMMMSLGVNATLEMARNLGITSPIYPNYASALGASEVTLMELTRAYSVFPNRGALVEPLFIERIEDRDGRVLYEGRPQKRQALTPRSADIMTQLLVGVVERGTATRVKVLGRPVGGKTGTTNKTKDAWFIGFTPSVITGVWVGMDEERSLGPKETGSQAAAPIFISYMKEALKGRPPEQFPALGATTLARGQQEVEHDDEADADEIEEYYPEEDATLTEVPASPKAPVSPRQFFKSDLDG